MTTISILPESINEQILYRAICGEQQAIASTPGQALDIIEQVLNSQENTVIILQRFHADKFFTKLQQTELQERMKRFHDAIDEGEQLSPDQQQKLENLIEIELEATIQRSESIDNQQNFTEMK